MNGAAYFRLGNSHFSTSSDMISSWSPGARSSSQRTVKAGPGAKDKHRMSSFIEKPSAESFTEGRVLEEGRGDGGQARSAWVDLLLRGIGLRVVVGFCLRDVVELSLDTTSVSRIWSISGSFPKDEELTLARLGELFSD